MIFYHHNTFFAQISLVAILLFFCCAIVFIVHLPVLSVQANSFDDDEYLLDNKLVQNPCLDSAWHFLSEIGTPTTVEGYYQPLTMISLMLDYALGGRADNLKIFHLTSLLLHVVNTALIILFLYNLFGSVWPAFFVGLLFGLHPMTVEAIAWISERKTPLASFFALGCLNLYVVYTRKPDRILYFGVVLTYVLALLSKPTVTFLPVLLLILDFWPLGRLNKKTIAEKIPLIAIMIIFAFITIISQNNAAGILMPTDTGLDKIPLIICYNIVFYIYKIFWPVNLAYYPYPLDMSIHNPIIMGSVISTFAFLGLLVFSLRWTRAFAAGWFFFFIAIFPTMGIIGFTNVIASDKYAYFPAIGFLIVIMWFLSKLWNYASRNTSFQNTQRALRQLTVIIVLFLICGEALASRQQISRWQTTETLYKYYLRFAPYAPSLYYNYGFYLYNHGRYDEAMEQFSRQLQFARRVDEKVLNIIGILHYRRGNNEQAIAAWQKVLEIKPDFPDALNNLAWVKATSSEERFRDPNEAIKLSLRACEIMQKKQFMPDYLDTLAAAYACSDDFVKAVETARKAIELAHEVGKKDMAKRIQEHLDSYLSGKALVEKLP